MQGIAITDQVGRGVWQYSTDGTTWTEWGAVSASHALLLSGSSEVRYVPDSTNGEMAIFTFVAWDQTTDTASADTRRATPTPLPAAARVPIRRSRRPPCSPSPTSTTRRCCRACSDFTTITEDDLDNAGNLVSDLIAGQISDVDIGAFQGIAVTSLDSANGTWQFSTDAGMNWSDVGDVEQHIGSVIDSRQPLALCPKWRHGATAGVTFEAWDTSDGNVTGNKVDASATGGSSPFAQRPPPAASPSRASTTRRSSPPARRKK